MYWKLLWFVFFANKMATACPPLCQCPFMLSGRDIAFIRKYWDYHGFYHSMTNCSSSNLKYLPREIDEDTYSLDLSFNNFTMLNDYEFHGLGITHLQILYLNNNSITEIEENSFHGLEYLLKLDLQGNKITYLHPKIFYHCPELKYLSLSGNKLILENDLVFNSLEILKLSYCGLNSLPEKIFNEKLVDIDISYNNLNINLSRVNISIIKASYNHKVYIDNMQERQLYVLEDLDLEGNDIIITNEKTNFRAPLIRKLNLGFCNLKNVSFNFLVNLKNISILDLHGNRLQFFNLSHLQNLAELNVRNNTIRKLDVNTFSSQPSFERLDISYNSLDISSNSSILNSSSLKYLLLQFCNISALTNFTFENTPHLLVINLSNNHLTNIEDVHFKGLKELQYLNIDFNEVMYINRASFITNKNLRQLRVEGNPLQIPYDEPFISAPSLLFLNVRTCNLTILSNNTFRNTPYLKSILLDNNYLKYININAFVKLKHLLFLSMENNPLKCNDELKEVLTWCLETGTHCQATCVEPKGNWKMLEHMEFTNHSVKSHTPVNISQPPGAALTEDTKVVHSSGWMYGVLTIGILLGTLLGIVVSKIVLPRCSFMQRTNDITLAG